MSTTLQAKLSATVELSWLSAAQGGRKRAVTTSDYAATAYFAEGNKQLFSIILHFPTKLESGVEIPIQTEHAVMNFLAPELVRSQLKKDIRFYVTEGSRVVAEGNVLSVLD
jgi:translation elongation factor EF-Tu-like GTPase